MLQPYPSSQTLLARRRAGLKLSLGLVLAGGDSGPTEVEKGHRLPHSTAEKDDGAPKTSLKPEGPGRPQGLAQGGGGPQGTGGTHRSWVEASQCPVQKSPLRPELSRPGAFWELTACFFVHTHLRPHLSRQASAPHLRLLHT